MQYYMGEVMPGPAGEITIDSPRPIFGSLSRRYGKYLGTYSYLLYLNVGVRTTALKLEPALED